MATIRLYGNLQRFGVKYQINASTAAEALSCLYYQIAGFRKAVFDGKFRVRINKRDHDMSSIGAGLHFTLSKNAVIHIVPVISGSGKALAWTGVVLGVALLATGIFAPIGLAWSSAAIGFGSSLLGAGMSVLLTKPPPIDMPDGQKNNNTSFSNLDNGIAHGSAIPLVYGQMMIGSKVISQGLDTL